jgi:PKD repeat protein
MRAAKSKEVSARGWRWMMRAAVLAIACMAPAALVHITPARAQYSPPTLSASPTNPQVGQAVLFTASTVYTAGSYFYFINFGDNSSPQLLSFSSAGIGTNTLSTTVTHTYAAIGTYNATVYGCIPNAQATATPQCLAGYSYAGIQSNSVSIVVGTSTGTSGTTNNGVLVTAGNGPYLGTAGSPIYFHGFAQCATSSCSGNFLYAWSFGDGTSGTGQNPTHTYSAAGTYTATLTVSDVTNTGVTGSATAQVCIAPLGSTATTATCGSTSGSSGSTTGSGTVSANGLTVSAGGPYTGSSGNAITFTGTASTSNANATIVSYVWSFGDGTSGTGQSTTHTYNSSGNYTVALTVTDSNGVALTATTTASIQPGQRKLNLPQGCTNVASTFPDNTPTGTIVSNVNPSTAVLSVWEYDSANQRFKGYLPGATQATDLPTVNRLDAIYICVNAPATFTEPAI